MAKQSISFKRYKNKPILTAKDIPYDCITDFNAAACKYGERYVLLLRVEGLDGHSHLTLAFSEDGYKFEVQTKSWVTPSTEGPFEAPARTKFGIQSYIFCTEAMTYDCEPVPVRSNFARAVNYNGSIAANNWCSGIVPKVVA